MEIQEYTIHNTIGILHKCQRLSGYQIVWSILMTSDPHGVVFPYCPDVKGVAIEIHLGIGSIKYIYI